MRGPPLDRSIRELDQLYRSGKTRQKRLKKISRVLSFCTLLIFTGGLLALYSRMNTMYALENFRAPVQQEAQSLLSQLVPQMGAVFDEAGPEYVRLAVAKFEEAWPSVQESARLEMKRFSESLGSRVELPLGRAMTHLAESQRERLEVHFPALTSADGGQALQERWSQTIERDSTAILMNFQEKYMRDVDLVRETIGGFRGSRFEGKAKDELTRQFIHLWLMRLDRLVMQGDLGGALDDE